MQLGRKEGMTTDYNLEQFIAEVIDQSPDNCTVQFDVALLAEDGGIWVSDYSATRVAFTVDKIAYKEEKDYKSLRKGEDNI
jgi:hypothetical protein